MDWTRPINVLIPGLDGHVLQGLYNVNAPQTAGEIHQRARAGSHNGTRVALQRLTDQGLVLCRKIGNAYQYALNTHHLAYPALKAALDAYDPYGHLRAQLADLTTTWPPGLPQPSLSIYGSVTQRTATTESDLDLLLIIREEDRDTGYCDRLTEELYTQAEAWTGNPVQLYTATRDEIRSMHANDDPIVASWLATADTVTGPSITDVITGKAR